MNPILAVVLFFVVQLAQFTFGVKFDLVTCGSVVKLMNVHHNVRLHSHDVKYGSGSGQQSVTGVEDSDDHNSHWAIKGPIDKPCKRGDAVKCGDVIRLEHLATSCLLHSHLFSSPLSQNQEVSCFGKNGEGDTGDHWIVQCDDDFWHRDDDIRLKHKDTDTYLGTSGNTYGRPISGQKEICTLSSPSSQTYWKTKEGVYIKPTESQSSS